jgi:hypothetical protein
MSTFNVADWYWIVGGNGPHKEHADAEFTGATDRVYSSRTGCYIPSNDRVYLEWIKFMGPQMSLPEGVTPATRIDSEENLQEVLKVHGMKPMPEKAPLTEGVST